MQKQSFSIKLSSFSAMLIAALLAYYILLTDQIVLSIDSIIDFSQEFEFPGHIFVLGLLPIYIAAVLFAATMFGIYLGKIFHKYFSTN